MFLSSLIEELCTKEENNKASCTLTFGGQCIYQLEIDFASFTLNVKIKKKFFQLTHLEVSKNIIILQSIYEDVFLHSINYFDS